MKAELTETEMTGNWYWLLDSGDRCTASEKAELQGKMLMPGFPYRSPEVIWVTQKFSKLSFLLYSK